MEQGKRHAGIISVPANPDNLGLWPELANLGMKLLAFDTSTEQMSIAVAVNLTAGDGAGPATWRVWRHTGAGGAQASTGLIAGAMALLQEAGVTLAALDAVCFGSGPGSFTGLRTACAVAQGLAYGVQVPVLPVDSLLALAEAARFAAFPDASEGQVMALLDARMDEIYTGLYRYQRDLHGAVHWVSLAAPALVRPQDVATLAASPQAQQLPLWLAGNAMAVYADRMQLDTLLPGVTAVPAVPLADAIVRLAPQLLAAGHAVPAAQALPIYVRDKVAQTTAERLALKQAQAPATAPGIAPCKAA